MRKLLEDARSRWAQFDLECEGSWSSGTCRRLRSHRVAAREGSPTITGDIAHVIEFEGGLVKRFVGYRDRGEAIGAAQAEPE